MLEYIKRLVKPINAFSGSAAKDYSRATSWITYEVVKDNKTKTVPIYDLTKAEADGWKRVGPKVL